MNQETKQLLEQAKLKPRVSVKIKATNDLESLFNDANSRKTIVSYTAKAVVRAHKRTMELLADK